MAEIYLARASGIEGFEKYVVLKRILPQLAANHGVRPDVPRRGARSPRRWTTPTSRRSTTSARRPATYFFTMEYLHGEDLRWIMRTLAHDGEPGCRSSTR